MAGAKILEVGDTPKDRALFNGAQKCTSVFVHIFVYLCVCFCVSVVVSVCLLLFASLCGCTFLTCRFIHCHFVSVFSSNLCTCLVWLLLCL